MKVSVYYNLHKKCLSVRSNERETYGKVIRHCELIMLKNVKFIVSKSGRARVLKEKRKNVHAFVRGEITDYVPGNLTSINVTYNPYKYSTFIERFTETPIYEADYVIIKNRDVTVYNKDNI